jgi:hypothetical protein
VIGDTILAVAGGAMAASIADCQVIATPATSITIHMHNR